MRKKLCIFIEPSPGFDGQRENSQSGVARIEHAADEISTRGEYPLFIHEIPIARRIKNSLKLQIEMVADENFLQETIELLADFLSKHSLSIYTYIVAPETTRFHHPDATPSVVQAPPLLPSAPSLVRTQKRN